MAKDMKPKDEREEINLGIWKQEGFEKFITDATQFNGAGRTIDFISRQFLGTQYSEGTLIGNEKISEVLVVDLSGMDCFTFIDYVEALRLSDSFLAFKVNLARVRYRSGIIAYDHRNHFFSDWRVFNGGHVEDVTMRVGGHHSQSSRKMLNIKENGTFYLPGIAPIDRTIDYIPTSAIDESVLRKCKTGDYIGIYTEYPGLDVTHVGIFIKKKGKAYLRHASSHPGHRKVIDQEFSAYMSGKPGFLVLRPKIRKMGDRLSATGNRR
jgi:Protein of unknown function (DUF1460)